MLCRFGLKIVAKEPVRFLPAGLAMTFSAVLVACQSGVLIAFLETSSRPIEHSQSDLWVCSKDKAAPGFSYPIPEAWVARLAAEPGVEQVEPVVYGFGMWHRGEGPMEQVLVIGSRLLPGTIGGPGELTEEQRTLLTRVGALAMYAPEQPVLAAGQPGPLVGEINGLRVEVVTVIEGQQTGAGLIPAVVCSLRTACQLLPNLRPGEVTHLVARCRHPEEAEELASRLRARYPDMATLTRQEMAHCARMHWMNKTRAGIVLSLSALLGLLVGSIITGQTFYSVTAATWRELAVLRAFGISSRRVSWMVLSQALVTALAASLAAVPVTAGIARFLACFNVYLLLPWWMIVSVALLIFVMAGCAGQIALQSLRLIQPVALLR
jgi:putative ABC transport system permease protein